MTGIALKMGKIKTCYALFEKLPVLRTHYFWPLLIHAHEQDGESGANNDLFVMILMTFYKTFSTGIFQVILSMKKKQLDLDFETWSNYVFPFLNLNNYNILIKKLQTHGFPVSNIASPIITELLKRRELHAALDVCK